MVIDWDAVKAVRIPEGDCKRVAINGTIVWEKGGLPSEYQQVEYIQSDGLQAIDTGVYPLVDTSITLDFAKTQTLTNDGLMGARSNNTFAIYLYATGRGTQENHSFRGAVAYGNVNSYVTDVNFYNNTDRHTVTAEYTNGGVTVISDGVVTSLGSSTVPSNLAWYLFACNTNNSIDTGRSAKIKMYACEISQNGETIRDFVPCYRIADGEIGMYDLVNGVFYTNSGSGTFIKGEDV